MGCEIVAFVTYPEHITSYYIRRCDSHPLHSTMLCHGCVMNPWTGGSTRFTTSRGMDLPKFPSLSAFQGPLCQCSSQTRAENCTQHRYHTQPETVVPVRSSGAIQWIRTLVRQIPHTSLGREEKQRTRDALPWNCTKQHLQNHTTIPITETEWIEGPQPWN